jgi:lysophospholipase L1-like esterase
MGHCHYLRWSLRRRGTLVCALVATTAVLASAASASAARLYVAVGDSVGAGLGATPGQSSFDLYCAYLKSPVGGSLVDRCVNESAAGLTSQSALDGGTIQKVVNDIDGSTNTPVVTVVLGANDLLGSSGCQPITGAGCNFMHNMRTILDQLQTALAGHPGPHVIQWLEYYNPNHDNPFANVSADQSTAALLLGNDFALTDCSSSDLTLVGLNDAINCIAKEKGATAVDAHAPFQNGCTSGDCFSDSLHPNDKGYGLIFAAFRDTPGTPVAMGAPQNAVPPALSGIPAPGSTLSCSLGTWSGNTPLTYITQWLRDNSTIGRQTTPTYLIQASDIGHAISCRVTASNTDGSAVATSNPLTIKPPPTNPPPPTISNLSATRKVFAPTDGHHNGTVFSFRLDQQAQVTIAIERPSLGQRAGQSRRQPAKPQRHQPRCTGSTLIATLSEHGHIGLNRIAFSGRVRGRALKPGRYLGVFAATNRAGASKPQTLQFTIVNSTEH